MPKIHTISIKNFRGIQEFNQVFNSDFVCLIGRGDSGKSTLLEAISSVLSSAWNLTFFDNDFYNCN
ncbi:MAG: AAA family ATPase, partial [Candidatus Pacearchaeota archaeon]